MKKLVSIFVFIFLFSLVAGQVVPGPTFRGSTQNEIGGGGSYVSSTVQHVAPGYGISPRSVGVNQFFGLDLQQSYEMCQERQDFIIQIAPGGCTPQVVRSDLLAEQNVPVFCELQAIQINPTISTSTIRNIILTSEGPLPPEIVGISYQRPRDSLRKYNSNQGFGVIDNLGYAVIVLRGGMSENEMASFINGTLRARVQYGSQNAFGFGLQEDVLRVLSEEEWQRDYVKYGFFDGQAYARLERIGESDISVGIYADADHRIDSFTVKEGRTSAEKYLASDFCNAGYSVSYVESNLPRIRANLELDSDSYDVYEGGKFADGLCYVKSILPQGLSGGNVVVACGGRSFTLSLDYKPVQFVVGDKLREVRIGEEMFSSEGDNSVYFVGIGEYGPEVEKTGGFALFVLAEGVEGNYGSEIEKIAKEGKVGKDFRVIDFGVEAETIWGTSVRFTGWDSLENGVTGDRVFEDYFTQAISYYQEVEDVYDGGEESKIGEEFAGEKALGDAIKLSEAVNKDATQERLIEQINERYENSGFENQLNDARTVDRENSRHVFEVDGISYSLVLKSIDEPSREDSNIKISVNGKLVGDLREVGKYVGGISNGSTIQLDDFDSSSVVLDANCKDRSDDDGEFTIQLGSTKTICGYRIKVREINVVEEVTIRLNPVNRKIGGTTNFSYGVGIEKRAIELTPEKAQRRIEKLTQSIAKWEDLNDGLESVVEGMKGACFATSAALQVKNLFSGMGGKAIARQMVMEKKWKDICAKAVADGEYNSLDHCYSKKAGDINADVELVNRVIDEQQEAIKRNDDDNLIEGSGSLFKGKSVNYDKAFEDYKAEVLDRFEGKEIKDKEDANGIKIEEVIEGVTDYESLRRIDLQFRIRAEEGVDAGLVESARETLYDDLSRAKIIGNEKEIVSSSDEEANNLGIRGTMRTAVSRSEKLVGRERTYDNAVVSGNNFDGLVEGTPITKVFDKASSKWYYVGLDAANKERSIYIPKYKSVKNDGGKTFNKYFVYDTTGTRVEDVEASKIAGEFPEFKHFSSDTYKNKYSNPEVRYYEREPYKGMPAVVPFDTVNGWYAGTKQTLPAFGNTKTFEDSGRVSSFWVCNVGENGREEFNSGIGDDICQQMNLFTGQSRDRFPGLGESESRKIIDEAERALEQAASQYRKGIKKVDIGRLRGLDVGNPQANIPETQCQNFMSPRDCKLMFNVCDPVICPSSRCNLGGKFHVDNVAQSGIVGSTLMCLPNIKEGIVIPVCLTGIHAGIDNYVSILKASRDCLQESIDTGRYVGICDEITAIYQCEFFWKQISPAVNVLLPRLLEGFTGNTPRGGGEYLSVQSAWDNMQQSIGFFREEYAVNSLQAFNVRSTAEAGTEICKGFVSTRYPNKFKSLIEADSPTQFSAWFDEIPGSDSVTPPVSHYKVFYHIFAGTDVGTQYSVYLKNPEGSSFYQSSGNVAVDTGFVPLGGYVSEARDFTAPSGFREVCVRTNFQEECGFKQVSTSFALNYVRDSYVKGQLEQENIRTEKDCISGTSVLKGGSPLALVNPNLQSGVEEALTPAIYERGIIRICSTKNPGLGTDKTRFSKVGICGDTKVGCWLDETSIDRAITVGHNASINVLDQSVVEESAGPLVSQAEKIHMIWDKIRELRIVGDFSEVEGKSRVVLAELDDLEKGGLFEVDRSKVAYLRARVYDAVTLKAFEVWKKSRTEDDDGKDVEGGKGDGGDGDEEDEEPVENGDGGDGGDVRKQLENKIKLETLESKDIVFDREIKLKLERGEEELQLEDVLALALTAKRIEDYLVKVDEDIVVVDVEEIGPNENLIKLEPNRAGIEITKRALNQDPIIGDIFEEVELKREGLPVIGDKIIILDIDHSSLRNGLRQSIEELPDSFTSCSRVRGDINKDGDVDIEDSLKVIDDLADAFVNQRAINEVCEDIDGDNVVSIDDVEEIIEIVADEEVQGSDDSSELSELDRYIEAVIQIESGGNPRAERYEAHIDDSSLGLGQLLTGTAKGLESRYPELPRLGDTKDEIKESLFNPDINIQYTRALFEEELDFYQDPSLAVAAYNAGHLTPRNARVQEQLNDLYDSNLVMDGVIGPLSEEVVKDFQEEQNLDVDGVVGPITYAKLQNVWVDENLGESNPLGITPINKFTPNHVAKFEKALETIA